MKIKNKNRALSFGLSIVVLIFSFVGVAYAADGDNALFTFVPLNGKTGENEVKLVVNTDNAAINHLIFDIVNPGGGNPLIFDMDGSSSDPVIFVLDGQPVLGTKMAFTTASGDKGYDLASANPADTASYTALHFVTLITDKNLPAGLGGTLSYDTDTAIYVNTVRKGIFGSDYTVLPNVTPTISNPAVDAVSLTASTVAPSAGNPLPATLIQNVSVTPTFTYSVTDSTDASVQRQMKLYKRLNDGSWGYPASTTYSASVSRSGTDMTFSWPLSSGSAMDYATYYKVEFIVTDDQTASNTETYYFSTELDSNSPTQVANAYMTFISDSNNRDEIIGQISFTTSTDDGGVENYYLWAKSFLVSKNILNSDGSRDLALDTSSNGTVSDEEFYVGLRGLVNNSSYISAVTSSTASTSPYFRITGNNVDHYDDNGTIGDTSDDVYLVPNSLTEDILYIVAADGATGLSGGVSPNFSDFKIVNKPGDVFGAEVTLHIGSSDYNYIVGDGSLDVWDAVYLYRNIIGRFSDYPVMVPDLLYPPDFYNYATGTSTSSTTGPSVT